VCAGTARYLPPKCFVVTEDANQQQSLTFGRYISFTRCFMESVRFWRRWLSQDKILRFAHHVETHEVTSSPDALQRSDDGKQFHSGPVNPRPGVSTHDRSSRPKSLLCGQQTIQIMWLLVIKVNALECFQQLLSLHTCLPPS
jgi:hypothetical protein